MSDRDSRWYFPVSVEQVSPQKFVVHDPVPSFTNLKENSVVSHLNQPHVLQSFKFYFSLINLREL